MSQWIIVGDGAWGRALGRRLVLNGHDALLVGERRIGNRVPKDVEHSIELAPALARGERVILAVPADRLEGLLKDAAPHLRADHRIATAIRGLTPGSHLRPSEAVARHTPVRQLGVLAGAADARALRKKTPAALVVGTQFPAFAEELQAALIAPSLRIYTNADPVGTELASIVAMVLGVALGIGRALGVGPSTEATALTRAVAEMDRVVCGLGGAPKTAYGLAGLGLLAELAFDPEARSAHAGRALAAGEVDKAGEAHEVRAAARALAARCARQRIRAPMLTVIDALFDGHIDAATAMKGLMTRSARSE